MQDIWEKVKRAIDTEKEAIEHFSRELSKEAVTSAVELIFNSKGKVVMTGVGKSGDIAKKISSTMTSTGTEAIFLHPSDAAHGDAGQINPEDVVLAIGKSGESDELLFLIPTIKRIGAKLISLTANPISRLAKDSDIVVITPVLKEACPLELAPTSSTTIALILGDAIAMALMELKNFKQDDFALYHPAGRLGKRLSLNIEDVMRKETDIPIVKPDDNLEKVLNEITNKYVGATCVCDKDKKLLGFITDFDLRKLFTKGQVTKDIKASELMNSNPIKFLTGKKAFDILQEMEDRKRPVTVSPIVDTNNIVQGIVILHDLLQRGLK
ncbi:MAG: KpsF/GutQ family sugar-phosphate isomerase [Leptospiraceae bacterium]|nr:KpsF/GutQ family sugar-phosphate isomerase [Leptospiraceae bacterium]